MVILMQEIVNIDGSYGEGGGQIYRNSLAYSAVVRRPVRIYNIRAKRSNPGLRPQHLTVLRALAEITNARVEGASIGSREVIFKPQRIRGGKYRFDVGTAGSISLVLQGLIPALLFADRETDIEIRGGTDVKWSPPIDAIRFVLIPALRRLGADIEIDVIRRGHYPRGGGIVRVHIEPISKLKPILLMDQGKILRICGISHCVKLPAHVAKRQAESAKKFLEAKGFSVEIETEYYEREKDPHLGPGSGIVLWAETTTNAILEGDALGERGKPAEKVGEEAARGLYEQISLGGAVDVHHTDQLIIFMALADGISKIKSSLISMHTISAIYIAERIVGAKFRIDGEHGKPGIIHSEGIGLER